MRLIDTVAFLPPDVHPDVWHPILEEFYRGDVVPYPSDSALLSWLRRLHTEEIYTEFTVLTTGSRLLFWSLCPERVRVETLTGKSLTKSLRAPDLETWATMVVSGTARKADHTRLSKSAEHQARRLELLGQFSAATANDTVVYHVPAGYTLVTPDDFPAFADFLRHQVSTGRGFAWDTETEDAGEDDTDAPNPYTALLVGLSIHLADGPAVGATPSGREGQTTWYIPVRHRWPQSDKDAGDLRLPLSSPDADVVPPDSTYNIEPERAVALLRDLYRVRKEYLEATYEVARDLPEHLGGHDVLGQSPTPRGMVEHPPVHEPEVLEELPGDALRGHGTEAARGHVVSRRVRFPNAPYRLAQQVPDPVPSGAPRPNHAGALGQSEVGSVATLVADPGRDQPPAGAGRSTELREAAASQRRDSEHRSPARSPDWQPNPLRTLAVRARQASRLRQVAAGEPLQLNAVACWNMKYDFGVMAAPNQGVPVQEIYDEWLPMTEDGMLLAALSNQPNAKLKSNAERYLHVEVMDYKKLVRKPQTIADVPSVPATIYACGDADWTWRLLPLMLDAAEELEVLHLYDEVEHPIVEVFMRMERRGILMNRPKLEKASEELADTLAFTKRMALRSLENAGVQLPEDFNIDSKDQLAVALFAEPPRGLGLPVLRRTGISNRPSTDKKHRNALFAAGVNSAPLWILHKYIEDKKTFDSYVATLPAYIQADERIRGSYHQLGAATGRTSVTDPGAQTFPEEIKKTCQAEGEWGLIDYSQIELRVLAAESEDPVMLAAFAAREDIHGATQRDVGLPTRKLAKNFNFGVSFGGGPGTIAETGSIPLSQAKEFYEKYRQTYTQLFDYVAAKLSEVLQTGIIRNWAGRARVVPDSLRDDDQVRRLTMNTPIQGGALDIAKLAMRNMIPLIREMEPAGIHPVGFNHDEFDFESEWWVPRKDFLRWLGRAALVMYQANPFADRVRIPANISVGRSWGECK